MGKMVPMKKYRNDHTKSTIKLFIVLGLGSLFLWLLLTSSIFHITQIRVEGNEHYSDEEICQKINLTSNMNFFSFRFRKAKTTLEHDPYIKKGIIRFVFPNQIHIKIEERKVRGYVPYMGAYLFIDENGQVLETSTYFTEKLPIVHGLEFEHFRVGEAIKVQNQESFDILIKTAHLIVKYNILEEIVKIDVKDSKDIHIHIRSIDVMLGDATDYDEKIRMMLEILKHIPEQDRGFLDIRDANRPPIFKYLT